MSGSVRIGISGWTYRPWRGSFYPDGLPQRQELHYAAQRYPSIEINGTFYGLQKPASFRRWRLETPDDFVFAIKGSRYITHMLKLRNIETALANFFASGLLALGPKLGPILWQFPPVMKFVPDVFEAFLDMLPRDMRQASALARKHDGRMPGRAVLDSDVNQPLRHAVEVRHESFRSSAFIDLLRDHETALVCADSVAWPLLMDLTTDFVYCRLHGSKELYVSGYDDEALDVWASRIRAWARGTEPEDAQRAGSPGKHLRGGRDVYLYFDNDAKVRAPADAAALIERLQPASRKV